jgi:hypothetical protein
MIVLLERYGSLFARIWIDELPSFAAGSHVEVLVGGREHVGPPEKPLTSHRGGVERVFAHQPSDYGLLPGQFIPLNIGRLIVSAGVQKTDRPISSPGPTWGKPPREGLPGEYVPFLKGPFNLEHELEGVLQITHAAEHEVASSIVGYRITFEILVRLMAMQARGVDEATIIEDMERVLNAKRIK